MSANAPMSNFAAPQRQFHQVLPSYHQNHQNMMNTYNGAPAFQQQQQSRAVSNVGRKTQKIAAPLAAANNNGEDKKEKILAERFKTQMCRNYERKGSCPYENKCMFAHGDDDMRTPEMNVRDGLFTEESIEAFRRAQRLLKKRANQAARQIAAKVASEEKPSEKTSAIADDDNESASSTAAQVPTPTNNNSVPQQLPTHPAMSRVFTNDMQRCGRPSFLNPIPAQPQQQQQQQQQQLPSMMSPTNNCHSNYQQCPPPPMYGHQAPSPCMMTSNPAGTSPAIMYAASTNAVSPVMTTTQRSLASSVASSVGEGDEAFGDDNNSVSAFGKFKHAKQQQQQHNLNNTYGHNTNSMNNSYSSQHNYNYNYNVNNGSSTNTRSSEIRSPVTSPSASQTYRHNPYMRHGSNLSQ